VRSPDRREGYAEEVEGNAKQEGKGDCVVCEFEVGDEGRFAGGEAGYAESAVLMMGCQSMHIALSRVLW
jgi:hypothetical protein